MLGQSRSPPRCRQLSPVRSVGFACVQHALCHQRLHNPARANGCAPLLEGFLLGRYGAVLQVTGRTGDLQSCMFADMADPAEPSLLCVPGSACMLHAHQQPVWVSAPQERHK